MDSEDTLRRIQACLDQRAAVADVVEELLPRTKSEAVAWAQRLAGWEEYRGRYPDQTVALARVISQRAMRSFGLMLSPDGRVVSRPRDGRTWQAPKPTVTFRLAVAGEEVRVEYTPAYLPNGDRDLFAFISPHDPPRPHCLSGTGYLSHLTLHDAVEACGGADAYAALFAEARMHGEEKVFEAAFEGTDPEVQQPKRKKAKVEKSRENPEETPPASLGEHAAQVVEERDRSKRKGDSPEQGMLF